MSSRFHEIIIGMDLGTRYMEIAAQLIRDNRTSRNTPINTILLPNCEEMDHPDIKQVAVFLQDDEGERDIIFGKQVSDVVRDNPQLQDESLEFVKLALHPKFDEFMEVVHVNKVLETAINRGRLQDFHSDLFEAVIKLVRDFYEDRVSGTNINDIPVTMQICVPAMWEDLQRGVVRNSAVMAGAAKAELREEPLCSAVVCTLELLESNSIKAGQCLLIADCGAGTFGISVTRLDQVPSDDQEMVLTRIGICAGNDAGSHTLNHQLLNFITSGECPQVSSIRKLSEAMGITEHNILKQASDQFDHVKKGFPGNVSHYGLNLYGANGAKTPLHTIHLPHSLIQSWYDVWIAKATPLLQHHIEKTADWAEEHSEHLDFARAIFAGGGMKSSLLSRAMEQVLQSQTLFNFRVKYFGSRLQCSQGALQHHTFQEDSLPPRISFYAAFTEVYSPAIHGKDAKRSKSKHADNVRTTWDRAYCLMKYDNGTFTSQRVAAMSFYVATSHLGRLHVDVYFSENDIEDSATLKDRAGRLRPGVRAFPLAWADPGDLGDEGFQPVDRDGSAGKYYLVHGWVQMDHLNGKLVLTLKLMKPGYTLPWLASGGGLRQVSREDHTLRTVPQSLADLDPNEVFMTQTVEIWDKDSSHFVTNSTGTCVSRGDFNAKNRVGIMSARK